MLHLRGALGKGEEGCRAGRGDTERCRGRGPQWGNQKAGGILPDGQDFIRSSGEGPSQRRGHARAERRAPPADLRPSHRAPWVNGRRLGTGEDMEAGIRLPIFNGKWREQGCTWENSGAWGWLCFQLMCPGPCVSGPVLRSGDSVCTEPKRGAAAGEDAERKVDPRIPQRAGRDVKRRRAVMLERKGDPTGPCRSLYMGSGMVGGRPQGWQ